MLTIFDGIKKVEKKSCEEMIIILSQLFPCLACAVVQGRSDFIAF